MNRHGGDIYSHKILHDFSANINPLGMPERVKRALRENTDAYEHYPDVSCAELKRAIAEHEKVEPEHIACGNGASDLIYRLIWKFKPRTAAVITPTFSEYERALRTVGCLINHIALREENDFMLTDDILTKLNGAEMLFVCNPNNPTGTVSDMIPKIAAYCAANKIFLVVDECFMDFVADKEKYTAALNDNTIILKAFTKNYALAGLRLGYMMCGNTILMSLIEDCGQSWSVSVPAQTAGVEALKDKGHIEKAVRLIETERRYLSSALADFGFKVYPSRTNFILFKCHVPLYAPLLNDGIAIRSCADFDGLDEAYFRIAVRTRAENEILINAIDKIMKEK